MSEEIRCQHKYCPLSPRPLVSKEIPVCETCYERMGSPKTLEEFAVACYTMVGGRLPFQFLEYCLRRFEVGHPVRRAARDACNRFLAENLWKPV